MAAQQGQRALSADRVWKALKDGEYMIRRRWDKATVKRTLADLKRCGLVVNSRRGCRQEAGKGTGRLITLLDRDQRRASTEGVRCICSVPARRVISVGNGQGEG